MLAEIRTEHNSFRVNLAKPIDISIPLRHGAENPNAFGVHDPDFTPFRAGAFVGSVREGGACNCENIFLNPHGNGTHTECVGHITQERVTINAQLKNFFAVAALVSIQPETAPNGDVVIQERHIRAAVKNLHTDVLGLIIRTLPNAASKATMRYAGTNPPYLSQAAATALAVSGIQHLLVDFPSLDREDDGGKMLAHRAFWDFPHNTRFHATVTEMVFIPDSVRDDVYLLNLHIPSFESDAAPSKPVLYEIE
ncbi:MAG: cyclase family protein [Candidatus Kapaibacterium sp.]|nr:MAG: cyclase family protein [Candidatus Kapabacteria bacterium]